MEGSIFWTLYSENCAVLDYFMAIVSHEEPIGPNYLANNAECWPKTT